MHSVAQCCISVFLSSSINSRGFLWGTHSIRLRTLLLCDWIPFDVYLSGLPVNISVRWDKSRLTKSVPCCKRACLFFFCALPENFFPSIVISLRPEISALIPIDCKAFAIGFMKRIKAVSSPFSK